MPPGRLPIGNDSETQRTVRLRLFAVVRVFKVDLKVEIERRDRVPAGGNVVNEVLQVGALAPRGAVVLKRVIQPVSQTRLLELPFGDERLDQVRLIRNRSRLVETAACGDEIGGRGDALEGVSDARKERVRARDLVIAEKALQRSVQSERTAPRVRAQDGLNAREVVVEARVRGGEIQFAERPDQLDLILVEVGLSGSADAFEERVDAFMSQVQRQVEPLRLDLSGIGYRFVR